MIAPKGSSPVAATASTPSPTTTTAELVGILVRVGHLPVNPESVVLTTKSTAVEAA